MAKVSYPTRRRIHTFAGKQYIYQGFAGTKSELNRVKKALAPGYHVRAVYSKDLGRWEIYVRLKR